MKIKNTQLSTKGFFSIEEEGGSVLAEMHYVYAGTDRIIIDHTEVKEGSEGKGLGKLLVAESVNFARNNHLKIMPLCPFAKSVFDRTDEYNDVLF
jgi:uncharacterized protein